MCQRHSFCAYSPHRRIWATSGTNYVVTALVRDEHLDAVIESADRPLMGEMALQTA